MAEISMILFISLVLDVLVLILFSFLAAHAGLEGEMISEVAGYLRIRRRFAPAMPDQVHGAGHWPIEMLLP